MESSSYKYNKAAAALDDAARARRFLGAATYTPPSGHQEDVDDDLLELVDDFYNTSYCCEEADAKEPAAEWNETLRAALADAAADAAAARICDVLDDDVLGIGVKGVMEQLRARGFDAGLCRSSWERNGSVPEGWHEYVDVVLPAPASRPRYIVEANFAAQFVLARPSAAYRETLRSLPRVLVATPEAFKAVAAAMCAGAEASIRGAGMHVAPWRQAQYVQAKWSAQYERSVAPVIQQEPPHKLTSGRRKMMAMVFRGL